MSAMIEKLLKKLLGKSHETTVLGIAAILVAVGGAVMAMLDQDPATTFDLSATGAAIVAGIGLIRARSQKQHEQDADEGENT